MHEPTLVAFDRDGHVQTIQNRTPLDELMEAEEVGQDEVTLSAEEYHDLVTKARVAAFSALLDYIWFQTRSPWCAMKRLLAITRKISPNKIRGMSATEVGELLNETRAATSAREIRVVEGYLKRWGVLGFQGLGGNKSMETRRRCAAAQLGNSNRKGKKLSENN